MFKFLIILMLIFFMVCVSFYGIISFVDHEYMINNYSAINFIILISVIICYFVFKKGEITSKRLRLSIENMLDGYALHKAIFDKNGKMIDFKYVEFNPAGQRMVNISRDNIVGKTALQNFPGTVKNGLMDKFAKVMATGESINITDFHYSSNMIDKIFNIFCFRIDKKHFVCIFQDISERKKDEKRLMMSAADLKKSNEELEQFAYIASHDLQEPLRAVSSYCQLLKEKEYNNIDEESKKFLDYTIESSLRMKILIKELLDYSRVGRKDKPSEKINLEELLQEVLYDFEILIEDLDAEIIIESDMPEIFAIRFRIKQLLHNIIGNSLKFRSKEKPIIRIGCCIESNLNSNFWLFYVKDNGIGIDAKYYDRIFGIFKRLYAREQYSGTGIGLALCKKIVETHGGEIWVESEKNKGTYIYFTISKVWSIFDD